MTNITPHVQRH